LTSTAGSPPLGATAGQFIALIETSLTGEQAAGLLGIDASTVRGRISRGELYAIRVGRKNRLPRWQFTAHGALPHLGAVLAALPRDAHPLEVEAFFDLPCADLRVGERDTSPRGWLAGGGEPTPVLGLAAGLAISP
jgi:excisionase family DNA binding protein